jgi:glyoxylase-like metal-dependent hydrolase (beta-lactamase superfamily II)
MHPDHGHMTRSARDPDAALARRLEVARQSGVPEEALRRYAEARKGMGFGIAEVVEPDRELLPGVVVETDLGPWEVHHTPGHAPSHVCLHQPGRRLLVSGDHLLGRVSLFYDIGDRPDPAQDFLDSLDVVDGLDARLCLPGHGRTFTDIAAKVQANRELVHERLAKVEGAIAERPLTAVEVVPRVYGEPMTPLNGNWWLSETLTYLRHLELEGRAAREGRDPERWTTAS